MPKIIVSIDGVVLKEVQLTKDRTTLGRRPYNDVVIENLAVSGEHAILGMSGDTVYFEDLNSTNGSYINGKAFKKHLLQINDVIEIGKYKIKYVNDVSAAGPVPPAASAGTGSNAVIKVISGNAAGREVMLVKVVTTIGKPGVAVAAITKRPQGFVVSHMEGLDRLLLNGVPVGSEAAMLKNGDLLELAGTR